jgi:molybdate transport system substrate-binding protein
LRDVFPQVIDRFAAEHPDIGARADFSCPPCLLTSRMDEGVEMDVFISAGDVELKLLADAGLLDRTTTQAIGSARLVVAVPPGNPLRVKGLGDLHRPEVREISIGDPEQTSPGHYARQAFERMGLWKEIEGKLSFTKTGCESMKTVVLGQADAALLYDFCLHGGPDEPVVAAEVPERLHDPILVSVTAAPERRRAELQALMEYLDSPAVQQVLQAHGIHPVPDAGAEPAR